MTTCTLLKSINTYDSNGKNTGPVAAHCTKKEGHNGPCAGVVDVEPPAAVTEVIPGAGIPNALDDE